MTVARIDPHRLMSVAKSLGWRVTTSKQQRVRFHPPGGGVPIIGPAVFTDRRGWQTVVSQLQATGVPTSALRGIRTTTAATSDNVVDKILTAPRVVDQDQARVTLRKLLDSEPASVRQLTAMARLEGARLLPKEVGAVLSEMVGAGEAVVVGDGFTRVAWREYEPILSPTQVSADTAELVRPVSGGSMVRSGPSPAGRKPRKTLWCVLLRRVWHITLHNRSHGDVRTLCGYLLDPEPTTELRQPTCTDCDAEKDRFI